MDTTKITITVQDPLYHKYPGQSNPQPAYLTIVPESERCYLDSSSEIGNAMPMEVWHGVQIRIGVPPCVDPGMITEWLESEKAQILLGRIIAGHRVEWDGSNHRGRMSEDSVSALEELEYELAPGRIPESWFLTWYDSVSEYAPDLWEGRGKVPGDREGLSSRYLCELSDAELETLSVRLMEEFEAAAEGNVRFAFDSGDILKTLRDIARDYSTECDECSNRVPDQETRTLCRSCQESGDRTR
jgi:hypothetical protein